MISVNGVSVLFGGFYLLNKVSFLINKKDRIGLTGHNGAGKSTMLKIIAGEQNPSEGNVTMSSEVKIGYLPQTKVYTNGFTVKDEAKKAFSHFIELQAELDKLVNELSVREDYESDSYLKIINRMDEINSILNISGVESMDGEVELVLKGLGFVESDFNRNCEEFSGGWRMRIELAKILLSKPDVFLLDEPTNHLDIESISWLESFLQAYSGAVVLVSHDRAFLDNITKRTVEISMGKIYDYKVPYTQYLELRKERREQQQRAYENQQKMMKDIEDFIERFRYKATKSVQVQSRIKQLEKIDRIVVDDTDNSHIAVNFQPALRSGEMVVTGKNLSKYYGDKLILEDIDLTITRGEKIAFVGKNGEGKSTMAKMIMNEISFNGELKIGHNVNIGYFAQNQADLLDPEISILETIDAVAVGDIRKKIRDILGAFLFSGEDVDKKVKVLSGGERTRLAMVRLLLEPYNLLLLDEPTNHLDIRTKDILKEALNNFEGTVIIISHDRDFLKGLATKVYEFTNHGIREHLGGIDVFMQSKKIECFREYETMHKNSKALDSESDSIVSENKLSFEDGKKLNRQVKKIEKEISKYEEEISTLEYTISTIEKKLSLGKVNDELLKQYDEAKSDLNLNMHEWEESHSKLEKLQNK